jgi:hypothetical protein
MKTARSRVELALIAGVLLFGGVMGWVTLRHLAERVPSGPTQKRAAVVTPRTPPREASSTTQEAAPQQPATPARSGTKVRLDPDARSALKRVGADPDAERYWIQAINNPFLPPEERQDLIEDLNEDGLSDPKNPGAGDLPLITSRLRLIEELMPKAMDRVNADAFQEAHKDLVKMQARLAGR